jgi:molybdopterin/thiamine biosynthesis adenylyltransferase
MRGIGIPDTQTAGELSQEILMKNIIVFSENTLNQLIRDHLFQDDKEQLASILCGISQSPNQTKFLCREVIRARPGDLKHHSPTRASASKDYRKRILIECLEGGFSLIDCHSHPFSYQDVYFSNLDDRNDLENSAYFSEKIPNAHYISMVFGRNTFRARLFDKEQRKMTPIEEFIITGPNMRKISQTIEQPNPETFDRQILLFGEEGQKKLSGTKVAIGGAGGTGSIVFEQLTRLGVGEIILIDHDTVDPTSLNRLIGSVPKDINAPKAEVLKKYAEMYSKTEVTAVIKNILEPSALELLKEADLIFNCTDTQSTRIVQNETAVKYLIPLIDLGTGITTEKGFIEAGGNVRIVLPDSFCLACIDGINYVKAARELMNEEDIQMRQRAGYIQGHNIPGPSVISLNATIASFAVTEFLNIICGIRKPNTYITYDMQSGRTLARVLEAQKDEGCPVCGRNGIQAMGDLKPFKNLLEKATPQNIPDITNKREEELQHGCSD